MKKTEEDEPLNKRWWSKQAMAEQERQKTLMHEMMSRKFLQ